MQSSQLANVCCAERITHWGTISSCLYCLFYHISIRDVISGKRLVIFFSYSESQILVLQNILAPPSALYGIIKIIS